MKKKKCLARARVCTPAAHACSQVLIMPPVTRTATYSYFQPYLYIFGSDKNITHSAISTVQQSNPNTSQLGLLLLLPAQAQIVEPQHPSLGPAGFVSGGIPPPPWAPVFLLAFVFAINRSPSLGQDLSPNGVLLFSRRVSFKSFSPLHYPSIRHNGMLVWGVKLKTFEKNIRF